MWIDIKLNMFSEVLADTTCDHKTLSLTNNLITYQINDGWEITRGEDYGRGHANNLALSDVHFLFVRHLGPSVLDQPRKMNMDFVG